jgi:hypothetical protein
MYRSMMESTTKSRSKPITKGVRIMVARDDQSVPHATAVALGDDPTDFADTLVMWGLDSPDDSDEPPRDWFS